ncbi:MAG: prolipoprotein diacylglyceryl transferase [Oscillospiraceae bacterium]|nr:prolipoprotein diacylglyceryl transferase [Oscillospiraceae bacterium]
MSTIVSFPGLGLELPVSRVAFSIGGFDVYWYGVVIAAGLALGMLYALKRSKTFGVDPDKLMDLIIVGVIFGVLGARVYYIVFSTPGSFTTLAQMIDIRDGGLGFYGAVIGAFAAVGVACRIKKVKILPVLDIGSIGFLIGQGIGRWGNFFNQEAFGCNTTLPWGMTSETVQRYLQSHLSSLQAQGMTVDPMLPVHPTFLYESLWCILGFFLLNAYVKHRRFDGELCLMFFAWNGANRAIVEGLRTDSLYLGGVRISQLLAAVGTVLAIAAILWIRGRIKKAPGSIVPWAQTDAWAQELAAVEAREAAGKKSGKTAPEAGKTDAPQGNAENTPGDGEGDIL